MAGSSNEANHRRLGYLPGLDGLRALAVIAVFLYHGGVSWAQGGFLGVEVFFVISGYLITSLLLAEHQDHGRIRLLQFWTRRARRLLPAVLLLIGSGLTYAVFFLPNEVATLRGDAAAATLYVTNWYFILGQKSYFEFVGRPSLFQHLWSLAVEEQFYLLWPVLLSVLLRLKPRRAVWLVIGGAIASAMLMAVLYQPDSDPSRVYYGTDTRAAGLLLGAALAFVWQPWRKSRSGDSSHIAREMAWLLDLVGLAALTFICLACWRVNEYDPFLYRGGLTLVSLATAAVIAVAVHPQTKLGRRVLSPRPLVWIGERSYGIYLWHWPISALTRPQLDVSLDGVPLLALRMGLTLALAALSYRYVEMPIRRGALGDVWGAFSRSRGARRWKIGLAGTAMFSAALAVMGMLGQSVVNAQSPAVPAYLVDLATIAAPTPTVPAAPMLPVSTVAAFSEGSPNAEPTRRPTMEPTESDIPTRIPNRALKEASAAVTPTWVLSATVTALGDSVMLEASPILKQVIPGIDVDAAIGRQPAAVIELITARREAGVLAQVVVIHIGNNGRFSASQFDRIMEALGGVQRVIFINNKVPRPWQDPNNTDLAESVKRYPNAALIDWYSDSSEHPEYFWGDGIHTRPEGAQVYASLIMAKIGK